MQRYTIATYTRLITQSAEIAEERQRQLAERFDLEGQEEVFINPGRGEVKLVKDGGEILVARCAVVSFYGLEEKTWRWAWEEGVTGPLLRGAEPLRQFCESHGWGALPECSEHESRLLTAFAAAVTDADGYVESYDDSSRVTLVIFDPRKGRGRRRKAA